MSESNTLKNLRQDPDPDPPPPSEPVPDRKERQTFSSPSRPYPRYTGVYTRKDGYTLQRTTDGQTLKAVQRPPDKVTRSKSKFYLVDGSTGGYVSSLWHREFEFEGIRYVITYTDSPGQFRVSVKDGRGST